MTRWCDLNATDQDVLLAVGLLNKPSGRNIKHFLAEDLGWQSVSNGHVYPALSRLEARDLISSRPKPCNGQANVHELTTAGEDLVNRRRRLLERVIEHTTHADCGERDSRDRDDVEEVGH